MKQGFLQALGVAVYCFLIGTFMWNVDKLFNKPSMLTPVAVLSLFSVSALICGLIVFYKPYKLFFAGKKKDALDIVVSTAIFLSLFVVLLFLFLFLTK